MPGAKATNPLPIDADNESVVEPAKSGGLPAANAGANEPSMDEILASIRKIISDQNAEADRAAEIAAAAVANKVVDEPAPVRSIIGTIVSNQPIEGEPEASVPAQKMSQEPTASIESASVPVESEPLSEKIEIPPVQNVDDGVNSDEKNTAEAGGEPKSDDQQGAMNLHELIELIAAEPVHKPDEQWFAHAQPVIANPPPSSQEPLSPEPLPRIAEPSSQVSKPIVDPRPATAPGPVTVSGPDIASRPATAKMATKMDAVGSNRPNAVEAEPSSLVSEQENNDVQAAVMTESALDRLIARRNVADTETKHKKVAKSSVAPITEPPEPRDVLAVSSGNDSVKTPENGGLKPGSEENSAEPQTEVPKTAVSESKPAIVAPSAAHGAEQSGTGANSVQAAPVLSADVVSAAISGSFERLAESVFVERKDEIDAVFSDAMRPLLRDWLEDNLPSLVERIVREEIERVSRGTHQRH